MKKITLSLLFGFIGVLGFGQTSLIPDPFPTGISDTSATVSVDLYGNTGQQIEVVCVYDSSFDLSDTIIVTGLGFGVPLTVPFSLHSLHPSWVYPYEFRAIIGGVLVDSTNTGYSFMTDSLPALPVQIVFYTPGTNPSTYTATVYVAGNAQGLITKISAEGNKVGQTTFLPFSNSQTVTGTFADSLTISGLQPDIKYFFRLKSIPQNDSLIPVYATPTLYYFTTDSLMAPTIADLVLDSSLTSVSASADVTVGNAGVNHWRFQLLDSTGANLIYQSSPQTITASGTISDSATGQPPHTAFIARLIVFDSIGSDTLQGMARTEQVPSPTDSFVSFTSTQTTYTLNMLGNSHGLLAAEKITKWKLIENSVLKDSGNLAISGIAPFVIPEYNEMPSGSFTDQVILTNAAGESDTTEAFLVTTKSPWSEPDPTLGNMTSPNPSQLLYTAIGYTVTSGDTITLWGYRKNNTTSVLDSVIMLAGITQSGTLNSYTYHNCLGGDDYTGYVGVESIGGSFTYSNTKSNPTIDAVPPVLANITSAQITNSKISVTVIGDCNGNSGTLLLQLYYQDYPVDTLFSTPIGTGEFNYVRSWDNLFHGSEYGVWAELVDSVGDAPSSLEKYFTTLGTATGIAVIKIVPPDQVVAVYDILGRMLVTPSEHLKYSEVSQELAGKGFCIVAPIGADGTMGKAFQKVF